MDTPICDFLKDYGNQNPLRLHMPGHKGVGYPEDITEIDGADSLYEATGIIAQSEQNAGKLFGCQTLYSAEGCSQCIRAMLFLAVQWAKGQGKTPRILALRNVHRSFLSAAALLDFQVRWLLPEGSTYLSCPVTAEALETAILEETPTAVYVTSPDYLGNMGDIPAFSRICRRHGVLLLVDNAHGAYLRFLNLHPVDLGADMCCDSAHKTLPVLTGGAYLHIARPDITGAKNAMALFGSTSPSYLILQSLDKANAYLSSGYPQKLRAFTSALQVLKDRLQKNGFVLHGNEPMKLTVFAKSYGYTGTELAKILQKQNIFCEFSDPDFVVMMPSPELSHADLTRLETALLSIAKKDTVSQSPPALTQAKQVLSIREAVFSPQEEIPARNALGRILAQPSASCPPAVPIVLCGQEITASALDAFFFYGIEKITVVK